MHYLEPSTYALVYLVLAIFGLAALGLFLALRAMIKAAARDRGET